MKTFNVLPTDPSFQALTDYQIEFIIENLNQDAREANMIAKGQNPDDTYYDEDTSWLNTPVDEWDVVADGHDEEDIASQVNRLTSAEDLAKIQDRLKDTQNDVESGSATEKQDEVDRVIQENIRRAKEEAEKYSGMGKNSWKRGGDDEIVGKDISEQVKEYETDEDIWI